MATVKAVRIVVPAPVVQRLRIYVPVSPSGGGGGGGGGGSGDVVGPSSAVADRISVFNLTTGKLIKDGGATIAQVRDRSTHTGSQTLATISDAGTAASRNVPASGNAASGEVVKGNDTRLSDARTPTAHTHTVSQVTDAGTAATHNVPASGNAASGEVVKGNDTRLADARTPTSHTHTLSQVTDAGTAASRNVPASGNAGASEVVKGDDARLTDQRVPTDGSVTSGKVAATLKPSGSAAAGDEALRALGTGANQACAGNDGRLTDARTPTAHTHTLSQVTDAGTAASRNVPASGNAGASEVVKGDDTRLTDQRVPTDGSVTAGKVAATLKPSGSAAAGDEALRALGTGASQACAGNDGRLSDARTPTAHTHTLSQVTDAGTAASRNVPASGNAGASEVVKGDDTRLTDQRVPTDGSVTAGKVAAALKPSGSAAAGDEALRALGTGANQACAGNDARVVNGAKRSLVIIVGDGKSVLPIGVYDCPLTIPGGLTITKWRAIADGVGSIELDLLRDSFNNYPPTDPDSITGSAPPALVSQRTAESTTLTGWTTSLSEGDVILPAIISNNGIKKITVTIYTNLN